MRENIPIQDPQVCRSWFLTHPRGRNSYLQLSQGEASTSALAAVVFDRRASDDRSEAVSGTRSDSSGLGKTSSAASRFAAGLIEVHTHPSLPVLVEMVVRELLVVLDRHCD